MREAERERYRLEVRETERGNRDREKYEREIGGERGDCKRKKLGKQGER